MENSNEIMWLDSGVVRTRCPLGADVKVSKMKRANTFSITFFNDSELKVTHTDRVSIGIVYGTPKQIYLKECDRV